MKTLVFAAIIFGLTCVPLGSSTKPEIEKARGYILYSLANFPPMDALVSISILSINSPNEFQAVIMDDKELGDIIESMLDTVKSKPVSFRSSKEKVRLRGTV